MYAIINKDGSVKAANADIGMIRLMYDEFMSFDSTQELDIIEVCENHLLTGEK
jgi:hypothetical protein